MAGAENTNVGTSIDPRRLAYPEQQAAVLLGISVRTLYQARTEGRIAHVKLGTRILYTPRALRQFLRENEIPAGVAASASQ